MAHYMPTGEGDLPSYQEAVAVEVKEGEGNTMPASETSPASAVTPSAPSETNALATLPETPTSPSLEAAAPVATTEPRARRRHLIPFPPPISSIAEYQNSKLHSLLVKVKTTIDTIDKEMKTMLEEEHFVLQLKSCNIKDFEEVELQEEDLGEYYENAKCAFAKQRRNLIKHLKVLNVWLKEQQLMDSEWQFESMARTPIITDEELGEMKATMMKVLNSKVDMKLYKKTYTSYNTILYELQDYFEVKRWKVQMEALWSMYTRVADAELRGCKMYWKPL